MPRDDSSRFRACSRCSSASSAPRNDAGSGRRQRQRNRGAQIDPYDIGLRNAQHRHRPVDVFGLRANTEIRLEGAIRFAVPEQIERERRHAAQRERRRDVAPKKARRPEAVQKNHGAIAEPETLAVERAGTDRKAEQVCHKLKGAILNPPNKVV
jgi:hypothetical protein